METPIPPTLKDNVGSDKKTCYPLLEYLDFLKPILLEDNGLIRYALGRFDSLRAKVRAPDPPITLEYFEISLDEAHRYFPSREESLHRIFNLLSFKKHILGTRVLLLDVLTVLVIIFRGSLVEKLQYLFNWYNISENGLMNELEHTLFIMRVADCFHRIKAIGSIDITEDDAKHLALVARSRIENGKIRFVAGLTFNDFHRWTLESKEHSVLVKFIHVLDRFVNTLLALQSRTNAINGLIEEKRQYRENAVFVPKMDLFDCIEHPSVAHITFRSQCYVSACISLAEVSVEIDEVYIRCEKIKLVANPFYDIPESMKQSQQWQKRNILKQASPDCCEKEYLLVSHHRCPIQPHYVRRGDLFVRFDVPNLEPDTRYILTPYTKKWKYPPFGVVTLPLPHLAVISKKVSFHLFIFG